MAKRTEGMTIEERAAYWKKRGDALRRLQRKPQAEAKGAAPAEERASDTTRQKA